MDAIGRTLREVFGLDTSAAGGSREGMPVHQGRDALVMLPRGSVGALCRRLAESPLAGLIVVVTPAAGVLKARAGEESSPDEARDARLVVVTLEELVNGTLSPWLRRGLVSLVVLDDAQQFSAWRHDFRPACLSLPRLLEAMGRPSVVALMPAVSGVTADEVRTGLGLRNPVTIAESIYRPNLRHEAHQVTSVAGKLAHLTDLVSDTPGPGIVVTSTIRNAETVYRRLVALGAPAELHHRQLSSRARHGADRRFRQGTSRVIVAASGTSMHVERSDIRFVVHYNMPASFEAFWEDAQHAGADGAPARAVVLAGREDARTHELFIRNRYPSGAGIGAMVEALRRRDTTAVSLASLTEATGLSARQCQLATTVLHEAGVIGWRQDGRVDVVRHRLQEGDDLARAYDDLRYRGRRKLEQMTRFCLATRTCRWRLLLDDFAGDPAPEECGHCDNCRREAPPPSIDRPPFANEWA